MTEASEDADRGVGLPLDVLASIVRSELVAAGLPVIPDDHPLGTAGAVVQVDQPAMHGVVAGVLVNWHANSVLMNASMEAWGDDPLGEGEEISAFKQLIGGIGEAMQDAIRKILTTAGLEVVDTDNDYAPQELLVTRRLAVSPWRARHDATFIRHSDRMRAAWNQRHEQERADEKRDS